MVGRPPQSLAQHVCFIEGVGKGIQDQEPILARGRAWVTSKDANFL